MAQSNLLPPDVPENIRLIRSLAESTAKVMFNIFDPYQGDMEQEQALIYISKTIDWVLRHGNFDVLPSACDDADRLPSVDGKKIQPNQDLQSQIGLAVARVGFKVIAQFSSSATGKQLRDLMLTECGVAAGFYLIRAHGFPQDEQGLYCRGIREDLKHALSSGSPITYLAWRTSQLNADLDQALASQPRSRKAERLIMDKLLSLTLVQAYLEDVSQPESDASSEVESSQKLETPHRRCTRSKTPDASRQPR